MSDEQPTPIERRFPIQRGGSVDWPAAEQAYRHYAARYGSEQSIDRVAERGGFGIYEFCQLYRNRHVKPYIEGACCELVLSVVRELGDRWSP